MSNNYLWLEVLNVRTERDNGAVKIQIQLKGDRTDKELAWWNVRGDAYGKESAETAREIFRALDSKRVVLAAIGADGEALVCREIRIQFTDSGSSR